MANIKNPIEDEKTLAVTGIGTPDAFEDKPELMYSPIIQANEIKGRVGPQTDQQADQCCRFRTIREPRASNSIKQWAKKNSLSPRQFRRLFQKRFGLSPKKRLNHERMTNACDLLLKVPTIKDAANQLGFHDTSHFCHAFREYYGVSPSQFVAEFNSRKAGGFHPQENRAG